MKMGTQENKKEAVRGNLNKAISVVLALLLVLATCNIGINVSKAIADEGEKAAAEGQDVETQSNAIAVNFEGANAYALVNGQQVEPKVGVQLPRGRDFVFEITCDPGYTLSEVQVISKGMADIPIPFLLVDNEYVVKAADLEGSSELLVTSTVAQVEEEVQIKEENKTVPFTEAKDEAAAITTEGLSSQRKVEGAMIAPLAAHVDANGIAVDDFSYDVRSDGTATIRGFTDGRTSQNNLKIPDTINYLGSTYRVTEIFGSAFPGMTLTGTLTIGSNVVTIGTGAFLNTVGFEGDLVIPDSVTTIGNSAFSTYYDDSANLGKLVLGKNVTTIGERAFVSRDFVGDLIIPDSVTSIGDSAFIYCDKFTGSLVLSENLVTIDDYAFYQCFGFTGDLVIPDSVTTVGYCAFYACQGFDGTLTLSNNLSSVGSYAFGWLSGLTGTLTIPSSLTSISSFAFYCCFGLTGLELPSTVTFIGEQAFAFNELMKGIVVQTPLMTIEAFAFHKTGITVITDPNALVEAGSIMYYINDTDKTATALYHVNGETASGVLELPKTVTKNGTDYTVVEVAVGAFAGCSGLTGELILPDTLKTIGTNAFYNCTGFTKVDIPDGVETIGQNAFYGATSLETMTHKKLANLSLNLPAIGSKTLDDLSYSGYEERGVVDSSDKQTGVKLGKAARWLNAERTEAEIQIDYGKPVPSNAKLDIMFVLDYSNSMLYSDDTTKTTIGGTDYQYPRSLIMDDLVCDAIEQLTAANSKGYDIRVGLTAFGYTTQWNSNGVGDAGFSKNTGDLLSCVKPLTEPTSTNYSAGLGDAAAMLNARQDTSRQAIVVFLSDGAPYPEEDNGIAEADQLRADNVNVYPMGIYQGSDEALKAISYDHSTIYNAQNTQEFEADLGSLLSNAFTKMNDIVKDVLSQWFEVQDVGDIQVSAGSVELAGDTVSWDLTNEDCGEIYTLKMKAKVKAPYYNDEYKPTNASLVTNEIIPTTQPELFRGTRYKVTYEANGGSGNIPVDAKSPYIKNSTVTVLGKGDLNKQYFVFEGWTIKDDPSGKIYKEGDTFTITQDTTLVAQWKDDYIIIEAYDFRMHISEAQAHQKKSPSEQLKELIDRGFAKAYWASTGDPVEVDYAVVATPDGQSRNIPAAVGVYDVTYYAGSGHYEVHTTPKATVYGDPFTVVYEPGEHGVFEKQTYGDLDYGINTPAFNGTPEGEEGWRFAGWAPEVNAVVTDNATYVAQWTKETSTEETPVVPPFTPDSTNPPTTPNEDVPPEVTRIIERAGTTFGQVDSISEFVIDSAETPLAQAQKSCWVHFYIMFGLLITAIYGIAVLVRRHHFTRKLGSYDDLVLGGPDPDNRQPMRVPAYVGQGA